MTDSQIIKKWFKNDYGQPLELSPSQLEIYSCITRRRSPDGKRNIHCITHTRFGKSLTVAVAILSRITSFAEKWAIVAPNDAKTKIIMGYIIAHIFDNPYFVQKFQISKEENLERIQRERSKNRLTFKIRSGGIGEAFILSAQEKRNVNPLDALMGFGSPNVAVDEASLIDDVKKAGIDRMLGDVPDPFLLEIGNPFRRNHFYHSSKDPKYHHIHVDYKKGLAEGRITQEQVERMRHQPFFDILYECKFPASGTIDTQGWIPLVTEDEYEATKKTVQATGEPCLGVDVAEGGDENVFTLRYSNYARCIHRDHDPDLMATAGRVKVFMEEHGVKAENVFIDATGVGAGVAKRLHEQNKRVNAVKNGSSATNPDRYANLKSQCNWLMREWIREGGCIEPNSGYDELLELKYRVVDSNGKVQIVPKLLFMSWGFPSPNFTESLALTFAHPVTSVDKRPRPDLWTPPTYFGRRI